MDTLWIPLQLSSPLLLQVLVAVAFVVVEHFEVVDFKLMGCKAM